MLNIPLHMVGVVMPKDLKELGRRRFARYIAAVSGVGIAGCLGGGDGGSGDGGSDGSSDGGSGDGGSGGGSSGGGSGDSGADLSEELQRVADLAANHEWVQDTEQTPLSEINEITWQNQGSMDGDPASAQHAEDWQSLTGITATPIVVPSEQQVQQARTKLQGQDASNDIMELSDPGARELGAQGFFEELGDFVTTKDAWVPGMQTIAEWPIDGQAAFQDFPYREGTYLTPWFTEGWITFNHFEVLEEAGVGRDFAAESFTEFTEAANQVSDVVDTPVIMPFSDPVEGYQVFKDLVLRADGHYFDGLNPDFENDGFIAAADFLLGLVSDGLMPQGITSLTEGQTTTQFFSGKAGFQFNALGNLFLPGHELPIDKPGAEAASVSTYPNPDNIGYRDTPSGNLIAITAGLSVFSKRKALAADFMNFISTQEQQAQELLQEGNLPLRADVFEMDQVQEEMPYTDMLMAHLDGVGKLVAVNEVQMDTIVYEEMTNAMANDLSGSEVASRVQDRAEQAV